MWHTSPAKSLNRLWLTVFLTAIVVSFTACSLSRTSKPQLRHSFDRETGANISSLTQPLKFYREKPWLAANARDYIYLGPIEVSRTGRHTYLLWFGIWSTIDQRGQPEEPVQQTFQTVYVVADGEPMELEVNTWSGRDLGMAHTVYTTPVDTAVNAYYVITKDQIRKLARAKSILIYPNADTRPGAQYLLWGNNDFSATNIAAFFAAE